MTDPFSIASGVASLLPVAFKLCQTVNETIDKLVCAPRHFIELSKDLKALECVLGTLQGYLDDETTSAGVLHPMTYPDLETVLQNYNDTFEELKTIVCHFRKGRTTEDWNAWQGLRATWKESRIKELREQLAAQKKTLNVAPSVANYINIASTAASATMIELEISKLKNDLSALLERIDYPADLAQTHISAPGPFQSLNISPSEISVTRSQNQVPKTVPVLACTAQLFVKGLTPTSLGFMFSSETLVDDVLAFLAIHTGIPLHKVFLTYSGKVLEWGCYLNSYDVKRDSTLFASLRVRGKAIWSITIKNSTTGKIVQWKSNIIDIDATVGDMKDYVWKKEGIPKDRQSFTFADKYLEDHKTLWEYGVLDGSTVLLCEARLSLVEEVDEYSLLPPPPDVEEISETRPARRIRIFTSPLGIINILRAVKKTGNIRFRAAQRLLKAS